MRRGPASSNSDTAPKGSPIARTRYAPWNRLGPRATHAEPVPSLADRRVMLSASLQSRLCLFQEDLITCRCGTCSAARRTVVVAPLAALRVERAFDLVRVLAALVVLTATRVARRACWVARDPRIELTSDSPRSTRLP